MALRADLGTVDTIWGQAPVAHRLALAVMPVDAITRHLVPPEVWVGRETRKSLELAKRRSRTRPDPRRPTVAVPGGAGGYVVVHDTTVPRLGPPNSPPGTDPELTVRVVDPAGRWVPRRLRVPIWRLADVRADPAVGATSRSIRPWLLPGPAYPLSGGATGARLRVTDNARAVRWPRVEVFDGLGERIAWAHGDEYGEVLVVLDELGPGLPTADVLVSVRVHVPGALPGAPPVTQRDLESDPLADLPIEVLPRQPRAPGAFNDDATIGVGVPAGYRTASADVPLPFSPGRVVRFPDIAFIP